MYKLSIVFALFMFCCYVMGDYVEQNSYVPFMELPCTSFGGICVGPEECPKGLEASPGLCPVQQTRGVECCHGLSKRETRCSRLGHCVPKEQQCPEKLIFKAAKDCAVDEKCCILVN